METQITPPAHSRTNHGTPIPLPAAAVGRHRGDDRVTVQEARAILSRFQEAIKNSFRVPTPSLLPKVPPLPPPPLRPLRNGAYCNAYGQIHLRIVSHDTTKPDWPLQAVSHGISVEEAQCIATELLAAIQQSALIATGRTPRPTP
jgi:hypothetical protein